MINQQGTRLIAKPTKVNVILVLASIDLFFVFYVQNKSKQH